jgi:hypothetical protein
MATVVENSAISEIRTEYSTMKCQSWDIVRIIDLPILAISVTRSYRIVL